jgi:hypothetical protein
MSDIPGNSPNFAAILALAGMLFGGVAVKLIERLLPSRDKEIDDNLAFRRELREELTCVRQEAQNLGREADEWREKYYKDVNEWRDRYYQDVNEARDKYKQLVAVNASLEREQAKIKDDLLFLKRILRVRQQACRDCPLMGTLAEADMNRLEQVFAEVLPNSA